MAEAGPLRMEAQAAVALAVEEVATAVTLASPVSFNNHQIRY